jgi:hypothetical protein
LRRGGDPFDFAFGCARGRLGGQDGPAFASRIGGFFCTNNHPSAWVLYCRLNPDAPKAAFARRKKDRRPLHYDPQAALIRWGTREPRQVGDREMAWQNLFFHRETCARAKPCRRSSSTPPSAGGS